MSSSRCRYKAKFIKFKGDTGGERSQFPDTPKTWEYDPRGQGSNGNESRSQWHMPSYSHRDVSRERSRSTGRSEPMDNKRSVSQGRSTIEADRRSTPGRRSADRDRIASPRPSSSQEQPERERTTPNHVMDIPEKKRKRNGNRKRKRPHEEEEWSADDVPIRPIRLMEVFPEQPLRELKPIPEFHDDIKVPEGIMIHPQHPQHHFFPDMPGNSEESAEESVIMVIIDQTSPNHELNAEHAATVEGKLRKKLLKAVKMGTSVQFETQEYDGKFLRFTCANQETCDWLSSAVGSIGKLWEGASLAVVPEHDLPKFSRVTAFVPGKDISQETFQNALAVQNPKLDIHKWVLWECKENKEARGFDLVFGVPDDLLPKVLSVKGKAYYMFSKIILKIAQDTEDN